jgi:hypothetical protein
VDPDPDTAFQVNPDPDPIQGFDDQKRKKKKNIAEIFFLYLFVIKCPSSVRSLEPSKENIQHFKKMKFINFFSMFVGHFCPFRSGSGYGCRDPIESGYHQDPDLDPQH